MVEQLYVAFSKLAFVLLAVWVVAAGLGLTDMPGTVHQDIQRNGRRRAKGLVWATPVTAAPNADDDLLTPNYL
jgi:hypothetical protein